MPSRAIGRHGNLIYHISDDLRNFKRLTLGHNIIMGRKTYESLPGGPLPGRLNIVVTRNPGYTVPDGAIVATSLDDAIDIARRHPLSPDDNEVFIIGGGEIYRRALPLANRLYLTEINEDSKAYGADTFFPEISHDDWTITHQSQPFSDPRTGLHYRFSCLSRK